MAAIQQNQLLFNLDVPAMPINMVARYPRPEAIVIEKFGTCSGPVITAPKQAFQLSAVSEESLSQAVQLAKRDLKKQKEKQLEAAEKHGKATGKMATNKDGKKGHTEIIRTSHYNERLKKREERKKQERDRVLQMKEREKGWKARTMTTQTGRTLSHMPASSMSPPTRDVGPELAKLSGDARVLAEIRKLRLDMDACLNKIHQIHEAAKRDPSAWRPEPPVYAEDIEAERKRVMRREEQETRSLRTIYQLTQQVRVLQEEMNRLGQSNMKHDKKSQILSRLAAIHRGTVRALQTFIQHIADYDLSHGLPRSYHELGLLVRQLSLCCVQLEVADKSQIPDSVMTLLKDYAEINKILDISTSPKSPPRLCQVSKPAQNTKKQSPASRKLEFNAPLEKNHQTTQGHIVIDKIEKQGAGRDVTPEREAALRSAISILMRKPSAANATPVLQRQQKAPVPHIEHQTTRRTERGVAWDYPLEKPRLQQFKAGSRKGLLLPAKSRAQRRKVPKTQVQPPGETHYAEPTLSSRLKIVPPEERVLPTSPQQSVRQPYPDTAGICKKRSASAPPSPRSPQQRGADYHSSSLCSSPRSPSSYGSPRQIRGYPHTSPFVSPSSRRDVINQVQRDRENAMKRKEKAKINRLRQDLGQPEEWVRKAEEKIKEKLQPILDRAQEILDAYMSLRQLEYQQHKQQQQQQQQRQHLCVSSADTAVNAKSVDINVDLLADSLLGELLEDTVHEINNIDTDTRAEHQAAVMINMPSVETMVQRLQEMEKEQQEIRRRWATLVYEEENSAIPARARYFDAPLSEQPSTPTPIHVTSQLPDVEHTFLPDSVLARLESNPSDERAILFTKPVQQIVPKSSLHFSCPDGSLHIQPEHTQRKPGIHIALSQEMIQSIQSQKKTYEQYLKKNSYQAIGRFNPWMIVEEVANEILDDCLTDIAKELEDINSDIVNNVYSGEFNKVPSPNDPKPSSSPHNDYNDYSRQNSAIRTKKEHNLVDSEREAGHSEASQSSKRSSKQKAVLSDYRSLSPESVSGNYSYEDDFVESSARSRSQESGSKSDK